MSLRLCVTCGLACTCPVRPDASIVARLRAEASMRAYDRRKRKREYKSLGMPARSVARLLGEPEPADDGMRADGLIAFGVSAGKPCPQPRPG